MTLRLPRYVIAKPLANGTTGFYFNIPTLYRKAGCTIPNEPLGNDYAVACGVDGNGGRATALNGLFDEWLTIKSGRLLESPIARFGTSIGYSANTRRAQGISKECLSGADRITSGPCCCSPTPAQSLVTV
jgi:hypothetical protein